MKRRDFIKTLPLGVAAAAVPFTIGGLFSGKAFGRSPALNSLLNAQSDNGNILVVINLQGGNDGLNTVIPFEDPAYQGKRQTIGYISVDEIKKISPYLLRPGLALNLPLANPAYPIASGQPGSNSFYNMFKDGKLAIVQNVGYANPNRSHFRATDIWNTASDSELIVSSGWMGRYLETQASPNYPLDVKPGDDPLAIQIDYSTSLMFQGSRAVMASAVNDPSKYNSGAGYDDVTPPDTNAGHELSFVRAILAESNAYGTRLKEIFKATDSKTTTVTYPTGNPLAMQLQKVAWCIKGGLKTKVYFVSLGGFDTHATQDSKPLDSGDLVNHGLLHQYLGEAISLFQKDIEGLGFGDRVIGMTYSEFGRRVNQNGSNGTDHGTSAPMFLFGKRVNGELYGNIPDLVHLDEVGDLKWQFDFRQIFAAVLTQWFGVDDSLRKSILNKPEFTSTADFKDPANAFLFPVNGSTNIQNLFAPTNGINAVTAVPFTLYQNTPNPFTGITTISFSLTEGERAILEVFDSRGTLIAKLMDGYAVRGQNQAVFDGRKLPSGNYYVRLEVAGKTQTKQMTLVK